MATHSVSKPVPSKPEAQARDSATRDCPDRDCRYRRCSAFTLVELLVVIGIIALLAAIVTPAVMRAQTTARNAAIRAEIAMLHMAVMNYKNEYGSFPPCDGFTLTGTSTSTKHLQRLFPRCTNTLTELQTTFSSTSVAKVSPSNSLTFWLSGYTDDPTAPLTNGTRDKLFDFDSSRVDPQTGYYWPRGKSKSWYVYFDSKSYLTYPYDAADLSQVRAQRVPTTPPSRLRGTAGAEAEAWCRARCRGAWPRRRRTTAARPTRW